MRELCGNWIVTNQDARTFVFDDWQDARRVVRDVVRFWRRQDFEIELTLKLGRFLPERELIKLI